MGSSVEHLLARLARTFVVRHLRPTEFGIEDVESHWRDLPELDRQAFRDAMHAPADPELQTGDRPETRQLKDLPPGLRAVHEAVQRGVGARKAEALRTRVGTDTRSAGYLHQMVSLEPEESTDWEGVDTDTLKNIILPHLRDVVRTVYPDGADWNGPFRRAWVKEKKGDRDALARLEEELRRRGETVEPEKYAVQRRAAKNRGRYAR